MANKKKLFKNGKYVGYSTYEETTAKNSAPKPFDVLDDGTAVYLHPNGQVLPYPPASRTAPPATATVTGTFAPAKTGWEDQWQGVHLNSAQLEAVDTYTGMDFQAINTALNKNKKLSPALKQTVDDLESALHVQPNPANVLLYRGANLAHYTNMQEGDIIHDNAFGSATTDRGTAHEYASGKKSPVMFEIEYPKGTPGLYVDHISQFGGEHELIIPHGANYRVLHTGTMHKGVPVVRLQIVGFGPLAGGA